MTTSPTVPRLLRRLGLVCALLAAGSAPDRPANTAVRAAARSGPALDRHRELVGRAGRGGVDVLFLGDSITAGWDDRGKAVWDDRFAGWRVANFGINGDKTEHLLWRLTAGRELDGIDPKVVVLMIGTNNFGANSAAEIADGVREIVAELRRQKPAATVLLMGVLPRGNRPDRPDPKVAAVNARLAELADGDAVRFLDIGPRLLDADGHISQSHLYDLLHPTAAGYAVWAAAVVPAVEAVRKK